MTNMNLAVSYTREFSKANVAMLAALASGFIASGNPKSAHAINNNPRWIFAETFADRPVRCSYRKVAAQLSVVKKSKREVKFSLSRRGMVTVSALRLLGQVN